MRLILGLLFGFAFGYGTALGYLIEATDSSKLVKIVSTLKGVLELL